MGFLTTTLQPATSLVLALTRHQHYHCQYQGLSSLSFYQQQQQHWGFSTTTKQQKLRSKRFFSVLNNQASNSNDQQQQEQEQQQSSYTLDATFTDEIIDKYDAFILDQFGVLHNGINALDGAIELVDYLYTQKKKQLIILSNTSAPSQKAIEKLPKFGFKAESFIGAVTSGEEASRYIYHTYGNDDTIPPKKVIMLTWDAHKPNNPRLTAMPEAFIDKCGYIEIATNVQEADFVLFHGSEVWYRGENKSSKSLGSFIETGSFHNIDPILEQCLDEQLSAVCANPDFIVQTPDGNGIAYMPGKIAQRYEEMGGTCQTFGKPAVEHFDACIRKLGIKDKSKVAHVGDSLHHDITGATTAGIPTIFITSGIHLQQLETSFGQIPDSYKLQTLLENEKCTPTHVVAAFRK